MASIAKQINTSIYIPIASTYNNIRLFGSKSAIKGQPQFFYQGKWQSVCPTRWTENDADVFCRELGFVGADSLEGL